MKEMLETKERYYSVREAAERLGISKCRMHQLVRERNMNIQRIGNLIVIPESEILRLEQEERRPGRPKSQF